MEGVSQRFCTDAWTDLTLATLKGLLEFKDTHRPNEGPMLLRIDLP